MIDAQLGINLTLPTLRLSQDVRGLLEVRMLAQEMAKLPSASRSFARRPKNDTYPEPRHDGKRARSGKKRGGLRRRAGRQFREANPAHCQRGQQAASAKTSNQLFQNQKTLFRI